ncbi:MAG: DMT family transporter [Nakamurella sp.]
MSVSAADSADSAVPATRSSTWQRGPLIAVVVTIVLWSSAFIGIRYAAPYFSAGPLALLRLAVGTGALGAVALARRDPLPQGRDWFPILTIGVLWFGVYNVALNAGEQVLDAGTASMVINISPILIAVGAAWILKEGFTKSLGIGLVVAFAGSVVVGFASSGEGSSAPVIGVLLCVLAAVVYAISVILQKGVLKRVSAIQVTFLACATGLLCTLPFAPQLVGQLTVAPASVTWSVVYLGLFPTAIAFTTWAYALRSIPAGRLGVTTYAVPVLVVLMSWALLSEIPSWGAFVGGFLCLAGVAIARRR